MKIGQMSFRKPKGWTYSTGSEYSNIRNTLHFFSKQVHPKIFIGIVVKSPDVYDGAYRITIKRYLLKIPYHTITPDKIPLDIVNGIEILKETHSLYSADMKRILLDSFKKYGKSG